jgi:uncharacterized RDD family membrane protein YckC
MNTQLPQPDLLTDELATSQYIAATQGQRFVNYVIDNIFTRIALVYITSFCLSYFLAFVAPALLNKLAYADEMSFEAILFSLIVTFINYLIYYTICEKLFKGYTLGKLITGTRALRTDGGELSFKDAFMRSLWRCVPFEALSGFGGGIWHDYKTNTMVIKSR